MLGGKRSGKHVVTADSTADSTTGAAGAGVRPARMPRARIVAIITVVVAVLAGAATYALTSGGPGQHAASARARQVSGPVGATALRVVSITPASGTSHVNGAEPIQVRFTAPLAPGSPMPRVSPAVQGAWRSAGDDAVFTPDVPFAGWSRITVEVPAGPGGVRTAAGAELARPVVAHFRTGAWSPLRLSQLLSQLGYLPMSWQRSYPSTQVIAASGTPGSGLAAQFALAYSPPAGRFTWDHGYPASLRRLWQPAAFNLILKGAVMAFEAEHNMRIDGVASRRLWETVFRAASADAGNRDGYTYAIASKGSPETLTIWHDGHFAMRSLANTGIPIAPTADGTFPVYLRFRFQIMRGTNPDGSSYADPVSYVSYFDGGDAVHYFPRGSYGSQQSLGCVELPYGSAQAVWPYLTYGSLVTVTG